VLIVSFENIVFLSILFVPLFDRAIKPNWVFHGELLGAISRDWNVWLPSESLLRRGRSSQETGGRERPLSPELARV
jgi:hypothetical protein